jgi:hypothetical protein
MELTLRKCSKIGGPSVHLYCLNSLIMTSNITPSTHTFHPSIKRLLETSWLLNFKKDKNRHLTVTSQHNSLPLHLTRCVLDFWEEVLRHMCVQPEHRVSALGGSEQKPIWRLSDGWQLREPYPQSPSQLRVPNCKHTQERWFLSKLIWHLKIATSLNSNVTSYE